MPGSSLALTGISALPDFPLELASTELPAPPCPHDQALPASVVSSCPSVRSVRTAPCWASACRTHWPGVDRCLTQPCRSILLQRFWRALVLAEAALSCPLSTLCFLSGWCHLRAVWSAGLGVGRFWWPGASSSPLQESCIHLKGRVRGETRKRIFSMCCFTPPVAAAELIQARRQDFCHTGPGPKDSDRPPLLSQHQQGAGWEVEQLEHELASLWNWVHAR